MRKGSKVGERDLVPCPKSDFDGVDATAETSRSRNKLPGLGEGKSAGGRSRTGTAPVTARSGWAALTPRGKRAGCISLEPWRPHPRGAVSTRGTGETADRQDAGRDG